MAATAASEASDGPVLSFINKRLRALRKKLNRILQMEDSIAQGKPINKEQEDVLRSKPSVTASIEELEKLRQPLAAAVDEEISLAIQRHQKKSSISDSNSKDDTVKDDSSNVESDDANRAGGDGSVAEDLLNLLYFGSLFDVKSQTDFAATMYSRTHERGCCLTYDYVTDDATDLLRETDLDSIAMLRELVISRPVDSSLSHRDSLQRCREHAKLWLANSEHPISPNANISYAALREKLNKIMASDYFTAPPEMKAPVEVAAVTASNYASFQVPVHGVPISVQVDGSIPEYQSKDEDVINYQGHEASDDQSSPPEEVQKDEIETEHHAEVMISGEQEQAKQAAEREYNQREEEPKEQQYASRRNYQNQRGGRSGGGRRGYSNGRGGRNGGRGGGGYQNGRSQYYDQPGGNYYPRNYHNNRGRGGRGGGGHPYSNNHGSAVASDVGVAS